MTFLKKEKFPGSSLKGSKRGGLMSDFPQIFPKNGVKRGCFGAKGAEYGVGEGVDLRLRRGKFE